MSTTDVEWPDEEFETLRKSFEVRLRKEQALLANLAIALGNARTGRTRTVTDIGMFAHRLRGASLVFGFAVIGEKAKSLELTAFAASDSNPQGDRADIVAAMRALAMSLSQATGIALSPELACLTLTSGP